MAEVLTQSQIDALLNSMSGGGDSVKTEKKKPEDNYKKYDFYSPKKFTKDKLKILNAVYESYARLVSSRLNGMLRINSEVEVVGVEEQRYHEFRNALNENDVLTLVTTKFPEEEESESEPVVMHIANQLMLSMIDRMLGGSGEDALTVSYYKYTDIEMSLYETMVKHIVGIMKDSWSNYLEVDFNLYRIESNPSLMQDIGENETIVIIVLNVKIGKVEGNINICLPGTMLTSLFSIFDRRNTAFKTAVHEEKSTEEIFEHIKSSSIEIKARLGEVEIFLSEIFNLQVGDVINLNKPKDSDVCLYIGDKPWFMGQLGVQNKNMAVKINEVYENL